ncbi:MAG: DNA (cytosine-5-)-methyltransferase [Oscillospiraceae bacterium]|jgi:DNA (cytosine-5)-methyltransferase 1|nr:DNA (cytosine-5-)-methyltransferase [Oscillospiraceae bacterium]
MRNIRFFDYCSGLGAFRTGFAQAGGYEPIGWCEIDKTAQTAYRTLYQTKGEFFHDDARTLDTNAIPDFDLLVGGIPCQSFSAAGKKLAFSDERGQLFFYYAKLLEARKPPLFILENVPTITTIDSSRVFATILDRLSELGYHVQWQCIDGSAYLPQRRIRLFAVGSTDPRLLGRIFPLGLGGGTALRKIIDRGQWNRVYDVNGAACTQMAGGGGGSAKTGMYFIDLNAQPKITEESRCLIARYDSGIGNRKGEKSGVLIENSGTYPCINPTKELVRQGRRFRQAGSPAFVITATDRHGIVHKGRIRRLCLQETFRLQGFMDNQFFKVHDVVKSDSKLYKLAGNSIMVPVVADLGTKLRVACEEINLLESEEN